MTEAEWLASTEAYPMCLFVRDKVSDRKLRLLACAYCRSIWGLMDEASREAILLGEQMADEPIRVSRRKAVVRAAIEAACRFPSAVGDGFRAADMAYRIPCNDGWYAVEWTIGNWREELPGGVSIVRDIIGDPFHPVKLDPAWLTHDVVGVARGIYDERAFDRMAILGDTLERSGCTNKDILAHCHEPAGHVPGCWAVDAVSNKP